MLLADYSTWWLKWAPPIMMAGGVVTLVAGLGSLWLGGRRVEQVMSALREAKLILVEAHQLLALSYRAQTLAAHQRDDVQAVADRVLTEVKDSLKDTVAVVSGSHHGEMKTPPLPPEK